MGASRFPFYSIESLLMSLAGTESLDTRVRMESRFSQSHLLLGKRRFLFPNGCEFHTSSPQNPYRQFCGAISEAENFPRHQRIREPTCHREFVFILTKGGSHNSHGFKQPLPRVYGRAHSLRHVNSPFPSGFPRRNYLYPSE
jgi:hypothetical protein